MIELEKRQRFILFLAVLFTIWLLGFWLVARDTRPPQEGGFYVPARTSAITGT